MAIDIRFTLNGREESLAVQPADRLLDVLRDRLGQTSAKYGCGKGECGAWNERFRYHGPACAWIQPRASSTSALVE